MKKVWIILLGLLLSVSLSGQMMIPGITGSASSGGGTPSELLNDQIAFWNFNETSGTTLADEVSTHDLTTSASPTASGKFSYAQDFDNTDCAYVAYTGLNPTSDKITVSLWVYIDVLASTLGHDVCLFRYSYNVATPWETVSIYLNSGDDKPWFHVVNQAATLYSVDGANALTTGSWIHIVGVCNGNGTALELYVNSVDVSTNAGTFSGTSILASDGEVHFGNNGDGGTEAHDGRIDAAGIWDVGLSSTLIGELFTTTYPFN